MGILDLAARLAITVAMILAWIANDDGMCSTSTRSRARARRRRGLGQLRPAFVKQGTVRAGNASGQNDGAAACVVMSADEAERRGPAPLGRIVVCASAGFDLRIVGTGPIPATRRCLERAGSAAGDLDLIQANEGFAARSICVNRELGWGTDKVNVNGGAVALGHPIGASGARILVDLLHETRRKGAGRGLATLCIGGGQGGRAGDRAGGVKAPQPGVIAKVTDVRTSPI